MRKSMSSPNEQIEVLNGVVPLGITLEVPRTGEQEIPVPALTLLNAVFNRILTVISEGDPGGELAEAMTNGFDDGQPEQRGLVTSIHQPSKQEVLNTLAILTETVRALPDNLDAGTVEDGHDQAA